MKTVRYATTCTALVLAAACGGGTGTDVASGPSMTPPSPTPATTQPVPTASPTPAEVTPSAGESGCSTTGAPLANESSATCLYQAFQAGEREKAATYAAPEAVEELFSLGGHPTDDQWTFEGCGAPRETTPSSGVSCHYLIRGEVHPVSVEMAMRGDFVVESVQTIG